MYKALISCNVKAKAMFSYAQYLYMYIKLNSLMMSNASINIINNGFFIYYECSIPKGFQTFVFLLAETIPYVQFYLFIS
jgi:hypothetical protein